jgi:hypothetical protein
MRLVGATPQVGSPIGSERLHLKGALLGSGAGCLVAVLHDRAVSDRDAGDANAFCYHHGTIFGGLVPPVVRVLA